MMHTSTWLPILLLAATTPETAPEHNAPVLLPLSYYSARPGSYVYTLPDVPLLNDNNGAIMKIIHGNITIKPRPRARNSWNIRAKPALYPDYVDYLVQAANMTRIACEMFTFKLIHPLETEPGKNQAPPIAIPDASPHCPRRDTEDNRHHVLQLELDRIRALLREDATAPQLYWPNLAHSFPSLANRLTFACIDPVQCTLPVVGHGIVLNLQNLTLLTFPNSTSTKRNGRHWTFLCFDYHPETRDLCRTQASLQLQALKALPFTNNAWTNLYHLTPLQHYNITLSRHPRAAGIILGTASLIMSTTTLITLKHYIQLMKDITNKHNRQIAQLDKQFRHIDDSIAHLKKTDNYILETQEFLLEQADASVQRRFFTSIAQSFNTVHTTAVYLLERFETRLKHPTPTVYQTLLLKTPHYLKTLPLHAQYNSFNLTYKQGPNHYFINITTTALPNDINATVHIYRSRLHLCSTIKSHTLTAYHSNQIQHFPPDTPLDKIAAFLSPHANLTADSRVAITKHGNIYLHPLQCNSKICYQDERRAPYQPFEPILFDFPLRCKPDPSTRPTTFASATGYTFYEPVPTKHAIHTCFLSTPLYLNAKAGFTTVNYGFNATKTGAGGLPLVSLPSSHDPFSPPAPNTFSAKTIADTQLQAFVRSVFDISKRRTRAPYHLNHEPGIHFNATTLYIDENQIKVIDSLAGIPHVVTNFGNKIVESAANNVNNVIKHFGTYITGPYALALAAAATLCFFSLITLAVLYCYCRFQKQKQNPPLSARGHTQTTPETASISVTQIMPPNSDENVPLKTMSIQSRSMPMPRKTMPTLDIKVPDPPKISQLFDDIDTLRQHVLNIDSPSPPPSPKTSQTLKRSAPRFPPLMTDFDGSQKEEDIQKYKQRHT